MTANVHTMAANCGRHTSLNRIPENPEHEPDTPAREARQQAAQITWPIIPTRAI